MMKNFSLLLIMAAMCLLPYFSPAQAQQSSKSAKSQKKESYTMRGVVSDSQGVLPGST